MGEKHIAPASGLRQFVYKLYHCIQCTIEYMEVYYPSTEIEAIAVGNVDSFDLHKTTLFLVPTMKNIHPDCTIGN